MIIFIPLDTKIKDKYEFIAALILLLVLGGIIIGALKLATFLL